MQKEHRLLTRFAQKIDLPLDVAAQLPHLELQGFAECSMDCHRGILAYAPERIVVALNIGSVTVTGEGLEVRRMHRDRLTLTGRIESISFTGGGL